MKYLNAHLNELIEGKKITYRGKTYWMNPATGEIYAHSVDEEIAGSVSGYKVADVVDGKVIKA